MPFTCDLIWKVCMHISSSYFFFNIQCSHVRLYCYYDRLWELCYHFPCSKLVKPFIVIHCYFFALQAQKLKRYVTSSLILVENSMFLFNELTISHNHIYICGPFQRYNCDVCTPITSNSWRLQNRLQPIGQYSSYHPVIWLDSVSLIIDSYMTHKLSYSKCHEKMTFHSTMLVVLLWVNNSSNHHVCYSLLNI